MRKTFQINWERFEKALLGLGYKRVKESHYRKGKFHVITHPKDGRVEFHIHVDSRFHGPPLFQHRSRKIGKDINQECESIKRALLNVGSRQASEQLKSSLQTT